MDSQNNDGQGSSQPLAGSGAQNSAPNISSPSNHTVLAILSYLGPLVIFSYLLGKDNVFVKFHAKQGLVVFGLEVITWILGSMGMYSFWMVMNLLNLATLILSIIGIVNVLQGSQKELPLVGGFAKNFNI